MCASSAIKRAVRRVESWFSQRAPTIVDNLNGPIDKKELDLAQEAGFALSGELRELYRLHNGQNDWEQDFFLPNVAFVNLTLAKMFTDDVLKGHLNCPLGHRTPPDYIQSSQWTSHGFGGDEVQDLLLEEEWTPDWFCFGWSTYEYLVQHRRTRRVFSWPRKAEDVILLGATLAEYLDNFANALHSGECTLHGDPDLPEVEEDGLPGVNRHVHWYPRARQH